nr:NADH-quinone oxidoreductase subunit N [Xanthovirga aplysinae]
MPELLLATFILLLILIDLIFKNTPKSIFSIISLLGLAGVLFFTHRQGNQLTEATALFGQMLQLDRLGVILKYLFGISGILTVFLSWSKEEKDWHEKGEYFALVFGLLLGAFLMVMTTNLLMIFLSIELVSISSYILANFTQKRKSAEAGIKYLVFGATASAVMLYGLSFWYGFSGTLDFTSFQFINGLQSAPQLPVLVASFMVFAGLLFKITAVPFHFWTPDVYEGAPTPIVALFSVVPKIAGLGLLIRLLGISFQQNILWSESIIWRDVLGVLAILTMVVGNFSALWQKNAKRMMAYSSIGHSGLFLAGILAFSAFGIQSLLFYAFVYMLMNFAAFYLIEMVEDKTGKVMINDYQGLGLRIPFLGALFVLVMIALTGLPPTAGFTAKLLIFSALTESYQEVQSPILLYLIITGLISTVVSLFYYLKIPYVMFFKGNAEDSLKMKLNVGNKVLALLLVTSLLLLFLKSNWLTNLIDHINYF